MKPQEDRSLDQENSDDIVAPLTINQVNTDTASPEDEAELAQIWQDEPKLSEMVRALGSPGTWLRQRCERKATARVAPLGFGQADIEVKNGRGVYVDNNIACSQAGTISARECSTPKRRFPRHRASSPLDKSG